jgi:hypothetical protein
VVSERGLTELLNTLYVQTPGTSLHLDGDTVRIFHPDQPGRKILPLARIDQVVLFGGVTATDGLPAPPAPSTKFAQVASGTGSSGPVRIATLGRRARARGRGRGGPEQDQFHGDCATPTTTTIEIDYYLTTVMANTTYHRFSEVALKYMSVTHYVVTVDRTAHRFGAFSSLLGSACPVPAMRP